MKKLNPKKYPEARRKRSTEKRPRVERVRKDFWVRGAEMIPMGEVHPLIAREKGYSPKYFSLWEEVR